MSIKGVLQINTNNYIVETVGKTIIVHSPDDKMWGTGTTLESAFRDYINFGNLRGVK